MDEQPSQKMKQKMNICARGMGGLGLQPKIPIASQSFISFYGFDTLTPQEKNFPPFVIFPLFFTSNDTNFLPLFNALSFSSLPPPDVASCTYTHRRTRVGLQALTANLVNISDVDQS